MHDEPQMRLALKTVIFNLAPFEDEEWEDFISHWRKFSLVKNEVITRPGEIEHYFYYVHDGVMRGYILNGDTDVSIGFSYHGEFSGAFDSFLGQEPSDFGIESITETVGLKIHFDQLMAMFDKYKNAERFGRVLNARILIGMGRRQLEVRTFSAEERFQRIMDQSPHIFQLVPQKYLASYLGMTPETLSRMRKQSKDKL